MSGFNMADLKVLIVEDQEDERAIMRSTLLELGVKNIYDAHDGQQAITFMETGSSLVNLVVCDWNLPKMSGLELLKALREHGSHVPFMMVTGRGDVDSVSEAKLSGVSGYVRKPFSAKQLEAKMRAAMKA